MPVRKNDFHIIVSSGTGQITEFDEVAPWMMTYIGIKAPSAAATYDLQVFDDIGLLIYAENDITGDASISMERILASTAVFKILNATVDGDYTVRVYCSTRV